MFAWIGKPKGQRKGREGENERYVGERLLDRAAVCVYG